MRLYIEMETTDNRHGMERIRAYAIMEEARKKCRKGGGEI